jgi:hypothetical protein
MMRRWWAPLVIPVVLVVLVTVSSATRGRHVVNEGVVAAIVGGLSVGLLIGLPAFFAGVRYHRSQSAESTKL